MASCAKLSARSTLETLRSGELTEAQLRSLFQQGEEAVVFALLEMSKRLAEGRRRTVLGRPPRLPRGWFRCTRSRRPSVAARSGPAASVGIPVLDDHRPNVSTGRSSIAPIAAPTAARALSASRRPASATPKTFQTCSRRRPNIRSTAIGARSAAKRSSRQ